MARTVSVVDALSCDMEFPGFDSRQGTHNQHSQGGAMQKTAPWRRARKAALFKSRTTEQPERIEAYTQPKHAARMNIITRNREAIEESLHLAGVPAIPGTGTRRREA